MLLQPSNLPSVKHHGMITLKSLLLSLYPTDSLSEERSEKDTSVVIYNTKKLTIFSYTIKLQYNHDFSNRRFFDRNSQ